MRQGPALQYRTERPKERKSPFRREVDGDFGVLLDCPPLPTALMEHGSTGQNKAQANSNSHFEFLGVPSCQPPALDATMSDFPPEKEEGR